MEQGLFQVLSRRRSLKWLEIRAVFGGIESALNATRNERVHPVQQSLRGRRCSLSMQVPIITAIGPFKTFQSFKPFAPFQPFRTLPSIDKSRNFGWSEDCPSFVSPKNRIANHLRGFMGLAHGIVSRESEPWCAWFAARSANDYNEPWISNWCSGRSSLSSRDSGYAARRSVVSLWEC